MSEAMIDVPRLLESRRMRFSRWTGAAVVICALHVGGAVLALMNWHDEDTIEDAAGAVTLVLAPVPAAVRIDSPDVAHGPEQQEAKLTPEASKEVVEEAKEDIPPVDPSPAPEPEVALPKPQPEEEKEQPKEEEPQEAAPEKEQFRQDQEALATAPPRVDVQPAPSSAPSPGRSAALARLQASWQKALIRKLERYKRYPSAASRRGVTGVVVVRFKVDRSGQVISSEITQSSGSPVLDEEALALLARVSPLPAPPDQLAEPLLENFLPIWFGMKPGR